MRYLVLVSLLIFCATHRGIGQKTCSIRFDGQITSDIALSYQVTLDDSITTVSDDSGFFSFSNLCPGVYTVSAQVGALDQTWPFVILDHDTTIRLPIDDNMLLTPLYVLGSFSGPNTLLKKRTLKTDDILKSGGSNLSDLASNITGVSSLKTGNTIGKPIVGGMVGRRVVIYNNGVRLEGQDWGSEHGPEVDAQDVNEITVIKGPGSLRYASDALGGLVLVESPELLVKPGIEAGIGLHGMSNGRAGSSSAYLSGRFAKIPLSYRFQGTLKRSGNTHTPQYVLNNTGALERNFSARLGYTGKRWRVEALHSLFTSKVGIFSGAHIGNLTDLRNAFEAEQPFDSTGFDYVIERPYQDIIHELSKVTFQYRINDAHQLELQYSRQYNSRLEYDKDVPLNDSLAALNLPDFSLEITTHIAEMLWSHQMGKRLSGSFGLTGKHQGNTHAYRSFIPNFHNQSVGAFWIERYVKNRFAIESAIRYDHHFLTVYQRDESNNIVETDHPFSGLSGSLGGLYNVSKSFRINAAISSGWRMPWVNELYSSGLHHGVAALEYGDNTMQIERSIGFNLSPEYETEKLWLSMDVYGQLLHNYIYLQPAEEPTLTIQGAFPTFYFQQTDAWSGGIDLTARIKITPQLEAQGTASAVRIQDRNSAEYLPGTPSDRFSLAVTYSGKVKRIDWSISPRFDHVAKQWRVLQAADFVPPPNAYNLLSATATMKFPFKSRVITTVFRVENILNTSYRDYLNRFRYYALDLGRNYSLKFNIPFNITKNEKDKS